MPIEPSDTSLVDWIEWRPIVPSKKAVANKSGLRGHHCTWKAQLSAEGSYVLRNFNMWGTHVIATRTYLADDLRRLRIPAKCTVIFAAGQKKIRILLTPRERKHAFLVTSENLILSMSLSPKMQSTQQTFSGARAFRKSQTITIGDASSSEEVTSRVAWEVISTRHLEVCCYEHYRGATQHRSFRDALRQPELHPHRHRMLMRRLLACP